MHDIRREEAAPDIEIESGPVLEQWPAQGPVPDAWSAQETAQDLCAVSECCSMPLQELFQPQQASLQRGPPLSDLLQQHEHELRLQELDAHEQELEHPAQVLQQLLLQQQAPAMAIVLISTPPPPQRGCQMEKHYFKQCLSRASDSPKRDRDNHTLIEPQDVAMVAALGDLGVTKILP